MSKKVKFVIKYDSRNDEFYVSTGVVRKSFLRGSWTRLEQEIRDLYRDSDTKVIITYTTDARNRINYTGKYKNLNRG